MKIAVVILNWNGKSLLETYLPSVVSYSGAATLYVADNNSTDDSIAFLQKNYPQITLIKNATNGGYAKGYNDALQHVTEDICVLLNSDVAVTENWLQPFLTAFEEDENLVAAQPKILDDIHKDTFEYAGAAGGFIDALGYPFCRGRIFDTIEKDSGQYNDAIPIFWATGACLVIKKEAFFNSGGFDEDFFTHQEEIDLCWRLQALGGTIKYLGNSTVYHLGGGTLANDNPRKTYYNFRNSLLMLVKNVSGARVFYIVFVRMILDGIAALRFLFQLKWSHFIAVFKAHVHFYTMLPTCIKKRKHTIKKKQYAIINSIVWQYFVKNKRFYSTIEKK